MGTRNHTREREGPLVGRGTSGVRIRHCWREPALHCDTRRGTVRK